MTRYNKTAFVPALIVGLAALALAGCSGGGGLGGFTGGSGGGGNGNPTVTLNSFTVSGTNGGVSNPAVIDGNQNAGHFGLNWSTTITNDDGAGEFLALYLGNTANNIDTSSGDAIKIMQQNCDLPGVVNANCPGTSATAVPCEFDEANMTFVCPNNEGVAQQGITSFNVSQWLSNHSGLPGSYFLTLQVCVVHDSQGDLDCDIKTRPVNLN